MGWSRRISVVLGLRSCNQTLVTLAIIVVMNLLVLSYVLTNYRECFTPDESFRSAVHHGGYINSLPVIYVISPTYARPVQLPDLTRLSHTLMLVSNVHWIIVEDAIGPTDLVAKFVTKLREKYRFTSYTLLNQPTPTEYKLKPGDPDWKYPKGSWQRNKALNWLRYHEHELDPRGVVYFADDDNTYDLELFEEMRQTKRVAVWPVGLVGGLLVERPLVSRDPATTNVSQVYGFNAKWEPKRKYPIDMAGFALSVRTLMSRPNASFSCQEPVGHMESHFLAQFISSPSELEPRANDCSEILVWHTKTKKPALYLEKKLKHPSRKSSTWKSNQLR